jgi:hypothetical protein
MTTETIDSAVLDILADDVVVRCISEALEQQRKIETALVSARDAAPGDEERRMLVVLHGARRERAEQLNELAERILSLVNEKARG